MFQLAVQVCFSKIQFHMVFQRVENEMSSKDEKIKLKKIKIKHIKDEDEKKTALLELEPAFRNFKVGNSYEPFIWSISAT